MRKAMVYNIDRLGGDAMLFRKKIDGFCEYCSRGVRINDEQVLCMKKGVVPPDWCCRKFDYDPLKRVPHRFKAVDFSKYSTEEFKL